MDDVTAVLLGCAAPTGMGGVFNIIKLNNTSKIIIFGAGGVGLCACLACKSSKPKDITFIEPNKTRRDLAVKFGATKTIDPKSKNFLELFNKELCENFDYAIEASGQLNCFEKSTKVIKNQGGKTLIIGNAPYDSSIKINPEIFNKGKSILGTWGGILFQKGISKNIHL